MENRDKDSQSDIAAEKEIRLEKYKNWLDYDRIGLDIEACWAQIER